MRVKHFLFFAILSGFISSAGFAQKDPLDSLHRVNSAKRGVLDSVTNKKSDSLFSLITIHDTFAVKLFPYWKKFEEDFNEIPAIIAGKAPSILSYSESGLDIGYSFINIRGFDQRREAIFINGIPQNDPEDHNVYWTIIPDLASNASSIDVMRGTNFSFLYGPPAMGGSVNIQTGVPLKREFVINAGYGDYNTSTLGITLNSGLIDDKYLIGMHLSQIKTDGYRNQSFIDQKSYRLSFERRDTDFNLKLNFYGGPVKDGLYYYGIGAHDSLGPYLTDPSLRKINWSETFLYGRRVPEHEEYFQPHYEAITSWVINPQTTFYNTLFYMQSDGFFDYDGTWTAPHASEYFRLTPIYGFRYNFTGISDSSLGNEIIRSSVSEHQFGWIPKIEYLMGNHDLSVGGEFRIHRSNHWGQLVSAEKLPVGLPDDYHFYDYKGGKDIFSGYLSDKFETKKITASAGIQFLNQEYRFFDEKPFYLDSASAALRGQKQTGWTSYQFTVPFFFVNPRGIIDLVLNDFTSTYISASSTTREPRLKDFYNAEYFSMPNFNRNADGSFNFNDPKIKPEHIFDLELGIRTSDYLLDDEPILFSGGINGFYMPMSEEILQTGKLDPFGSPTIANAESVLHYGVELESKLEFGDAATLRLNFTWSHNEIQQFNADSVNVTGKVPIGFPPIIAGIYFAMQPVKGLTIGLTGRYIGEMFGDLQNSAALRNNPYGVLDASVSYRENDIIGMHYVQLKVDVRNLLNTFYTSYVESGTGFFAAAPRHGYGTIQIGL
jgi:iron complex outermembrane receptor protein